MYLSPSNGPASSPDPRHRAPLRSLFEELYQLVKKMEDRLVTRTPISTDRTPPLWPEWYGDDSPEAGPKRED